MSEYKDLTPDEIESRYLTEGSVRVSSAPLYRDVMRPGEDISITEGTLVYDIPVHLGTDSGRSDITGLLWTLLGSHLEAEGRKKSLSEKFGIRLTAEIDKGVDAMCDISVGFYRNARRDGLAEGRAEGLELGREEGRAEGRIENKLDSISAIMRNGNMSAEKAMDLLSIPAEERKELLEKLE